MPVAAASDDRRRARRSALRKAVARTLLILLAIPKLLSLLVPRRPDLVLFGARGRHLDNILGILLAKPGPPAGLAVRVLVSRQTALDPRLVAAVKALPGARLVGDWSPAAVWVSLRAGWVVIPNLKHEDARRFWLGRARLVYCNHGPWMKTLWPPFARGRKARLERFLFGRFEVALASSDQELPDYRAWFGPAVQVACLGYPRSALLDGVALSPTKVGLWPTWGVPDDPTYSAGLAERIHGALAAGQRNPTVEFRPHHESGQAGTVVGPADAGRPSLVVTDFSSVAFDQFYVGGKVLLYSTRLEEYLAQRGVRASLEPWLRKQMVRSEQVLLDRAQAILRGDGGGASDPLRLRPFDAAAFWALLQDKR